MDKITTLLHFSGGQDSTYVAYKWLKNNPDETIILHHVNLYHKAENRLVQEKKAVKKILEYFRQNGLSNFMYHESSFSYGNLPRITVKDIQIVSVFSAIILKTERYKSISRLLLAWHKGEVNREDIKKGFRVRKMLEALEIDRSIDFVFPIENTTRKEMFDDMPLSLTKLVWSCRKPENNNHCGKCKTCLELKKSNIFKYFQ